MRFKTDLQYCKNIYWYWWILYPKFSVKSGFSSPSLSLTFPKAFRRNNFQFARKQKAISMKYEDKKEKKIHLDSKISLQMKMIKWRERGKKRVFIRKSYCKTRHTAAASKIQRTSTRDSKKQIQKTKVVHVSSLSDVNTSMLFSSSYPWMSLAPGDLQDQESASSPLILSGRNPELNRSPGQEKLSPEIKLNKSN